MRRFAVNILIIVLIAICFFVWHRACKDYSKKETKYLEVAFLNVGQGDSILITTPSKKYILIDGGSCAREWSNFDAGRNVVVPYLKRRGIKKLDIVIATHPDMDHIGGFLSVLRQFKVYLFIDSGAASTTKTYEDILKIIDKKNIKYKIAEKETMEPGPGITLQFLSPISKDFINDPNNYSIVTRLTYGKVSFLFAADITGDAENLYVKTYGEQLKSNILKAPHHGSKSSNSLSFIYTVSPNIVIISVGKKNPFGHPSKEVLKQYKDAGAEILRTDELGHIIISTDGDEYQIYRDSS